MFCNWKCNIYVFWVIIKAIRYIFGKSGDARRIKYPQNVRAAQ